MRRGAHFLCCLVLATSAHAQTVDLVATWDELITVDPRSTLTLAPRVRNSGSAPRRFTIELDLPDDWRRLVQEQPVEIGPGEERARIVTMFIPQEARAGDYSVRMNVVDADGGRIAASGMVQIRVLPRLAIRLDGLDGSTHVLAGELIEVPFRVANGSNTTVRIELAMATRSFSPAQFSGAPDGLLTLGPNESARIVATVKTPTVIARVEDFSVEITAVGKPIEESMRNLGSVRASLRSTVEIIPVTSEEPVPLLRIPAQLDATTSHTWGADWVGTLNLNLSGGGPMDQNGDHRLDFRFQPSVDLDEPRIGNPNDTYRLNYAGPTFDVLLGDNSYEFSPLLGSAQSGRGIVGRYHPGQVGITGLYHYPPADGLAEATAAAILDYTVFDATLPDELRYRTALSLASMPGADILGSTYHEYSFTPTARAEFDLAVGRATDYPLVWATSAGGSTSLGPVDLSATTLYGSPGFPRGRGDQIRVAGVAASRHEHLGLSLRADSAFQQENLSGTADDTPRTVNAGISGNLLLRRPALQLNGGWKVRSRTDMDPAPSFRTRVNTFSLGARMALQNVSLTTDTKFESENNLLLGVPVYGFSYRSSARWTASPETNYTARLAYNSRRSPAFPTDRKVILGIGTDQGRGPVEVLSRAGITVATRGGQFLNLSAQVGTGADVAVWGNHTVSLAAFLQLDRDRTEFDLTGGFSLGYSAPLSIPTGRIRGLGSVEGFVHDAETAAATRNVIVRIADRAVVTGPEGEFRLTSLDPGEYHIQVDTTRVAPDYIVDLPLPIQAQVASDEATVLGIPIVRGAAVSGTVVLYAAPGAGAGLLATASETGNGDYREEDLEVSGGLSNVVVVMTSADERRRILSNRQGRFELSGMRPGVWSVSIEGAQLPRYHRLVQDEFTVRLEPGQSVSLTFKVVPIKRTVKLISVTDEPIVVALREDEPAAHQAQTTSDETRERDDGVLVITLSEEDASPAAVDGRDEPHDELSVDRALLDRLIRMAELRYSEPSPQSPRLLSLRWGISPDTSEPLLGDYLSQGLEELDSEMASESLRVARYTAPGTLLADLNGSVTLSFLDLGEGAPRTYLVGVRVHIPSDRNSRSREELTARFSEAVELFQSRWKIEHMERRATAEAEISHVRIGDIEIHYVLDLDDGSITIEYADDWFVRAEQSIIEFGL